MTRLIETVIRAEASSGRFAVSLHLVDDPTIAELNRTSRAIESSTDVLSFPLQDPAGLRFVLPPEEPIHLGDVVVSYDRAEAQAGEYGHPLEREVAYLVTHGILHLLGYDHEQESERAIMRAKEEAALAALGLARS